MTKDELKKTIQQLYMHNLTCSLGKRPEKASDLDCYQALALAVRDLMMQRWIATKDEYEDQKPRTVYYISLEFLMGRTLGNAMINLDLYEATKSV